MVGGLSVSLSLSCGLVWGGAEHSRVGRPRQSLAEIPLLCSAALFNDYQGPRPRLTTTHLQNLSAVYADTASTIPSHLISTSTTVKTKMQDQQPIIHPSLQLCTAYRWVHATPHGLARPAQWSKRREPASKGASPRWGDGSWIRGWDGMRRRTGGAAADEMSRGADGGQIASVGAKRAAGWVDRCMEMALEQSMCVQIARLPDFQIESGI